MPKKLKPKTTQELEELIEMLQTKIDEKRKCDCLPCAMGIALYECSVDTLLYALGKKPKHFSKMVRRLRLGKLTKTEDECSHSE